MANPQIEDGHIDIANEIAEALARIRIPGEEMQCLWVVFRKTYGWHKKQDKISISQFCKMTKIKRSNICRALNSLVSKKILVSLKNETRGITIYSFNKDFDVWLHSLKKETNSLNKETKGSLNIDNRVVSKLRHTKENNTKENKQKKLLRSNPEIKTFIDFYCQEFKNRFQTPPIIQGGKDGKIIQRLLKSINLEELKSLLTKFLNSEDQFIQGSGYTLGVFMSQIQKLQINEKQVPRYLRGLKTIWEEENGKKPIHLLDDKVSNRV